MNEVILLGRLTDDVKLTQTGTSQYSRFDLAVNGNQEGTVDFIRCVAFKTTAQTLAAHCVKGQQLLVEGSIRVSKHEGKTYYSVVCRRIKFLQKPQPKEA